MAESRKHNFPFDGAHISEKDRLLIARGAELSARAKHSAVASPFLSPREQRLLFADALTRGRADQLYFWGGCRGAERRMAVYLPDWILSFSVPCPLPVSRQLFSREREEALLQMLGAAGLERIEEAEDVDCYAALPPKIEAAEEGLLSQWICPLLLEGSGFRALSHRDWMGSLLSLGIKREILGDIVIWDDFHGVVFCLAKTAAYLIEELKKAGRDTVHAALCHLAAGFVPRQQYLPIQGTVASSRADGVVRALCNVSREDAAGLIRQGLVEINYDLITKVDAEIEPEDIVSVRGYGKFRIDEIGRPTGRGRIHLTARKYQ